MNQKILSYKRREIYVVDLTDLNDNINDPNYNYKYILNIIDHYSKLCGCLFIGK